MAREGEGPQASQEDRLANLEKRMKETEALVKGLTDELLDLKSIAMRLNRVSEERRPELKIAKPATGEGPTPTVVMPKKPAPRPETVAAPPPKPAEDKMDMIMQPDGTMKLEKRRGDNHYIVASASYGQKSAKAQIEAKKRGDLIVAEEEEKGASEKK
jgi:hypothetical protein